jgi:hypothetical protein
MRTMLVSACTDDRRQQRRDGMIVGMIESVAPARDHPLVDGLNLRGSLGHWSSRLRDRGWRRSVRLVRRSLDLPTTSRAAGVWAVAMVRNESDVIATTVRHLLDQDVARVLVVDNGSTDDTVEVLQSLGDPRLVIGHDREPGYYQAAKMTELSRWAARHDAAWVVPFDADELWSARHTTLGRHLATCPAAVARADIHNAFRSEDPDRWRVECEPDLMRKVAFRPHPLALLDTGNHWVSRPGDVCTGLTLLHLPWRSREQLAGKLRQGAAAIAAVDGPVDWGGHWQHHGSAPEEELTRMWEDLSAGRPVPTLSWSPSGGPTVMCAAEQFSSWNGLLGTEDGGPA